MMSDKPTDYLGHPINRVESPDDIITVWEITPAHDGVHDTIVIRSWQDAVRYARHNTVMLMDAYDTKENPGIFIRIQLRKTTLADYKELEEEQ